MKLKMMIPKAGFLFYLIIYFIWQSDIVHSQLSEVALRYGLPVLPGVTGFGLDSKGGLNGTVIRVTNLNKSGKGSLTEAIEFTGPRIINEVKAGSGKIINNEKEAGNYPQFKPVSKIFIANEWDLQSLMKKTDKRTKNNKP